MTSLAGWGRFPTLDAPLLNARDTAEAAQTVNAAENLIARGNGRAYGDAAINGRSTLSMLRSDRIRSFDAASGVLSCEAGFLLADLIPFALRHGFFPPVVPGTKFVTVGGMIAADVHGKNHHHDGTFSRHLVSIELLLADGSVVHCSRGDHSELFWATCGGMGLTGVILAATLTLRPVETPYIRQETLRSGDLDETLALSEASASWRYSVAWIDCLARGAKLGRGVIFRAEHATRGEAPDRAVSLRRPKRVPLDFPGIAMNWLSIRGFNEFIYRSGRPGTAIVDYDRYFFPLDAVLAWNRIYGGRGFVQYQCALPTEGSTAALKQLLERIADAGSGSFLVVLKLFGPEGDGLISFPMSGATLALDFPVTSANLSLLIALDRIVADHGGRLYLAKDARAGNHMLAGYTRLEQFRAVRRTVDPGGKFTSLLSQRLGL